MTEIVPLTCRSQYAVLGGLLTGFDVVSPRLILDSVHAAFDYSVF